MVRGGFGTAYGALGNLGYGGTLGFNYPFVYTQTIPSPDSNHPLLAGSSGAPATLENTFNNFNFSNPTVLQSPTPYTTTPVSCPSAPTLASGGQYIGSDYLGATLNGRQYNYQTPLVQTENLTVEDQFTNHDALQVGYVGTQGRHLDILGTTNSNSDDLAPRHQHPVLYSVPVHRAERHLRNHQRQQQLQLHADHVSAPDERSGFCCSANYTWSRCTGDQHAPQNSEFTAGYRAQWLAGFGIKGDYGLCDADATDLWHAAATYDLPLAVGAIRKLDEQRRGSPRGRVGDQRLLHLPERAADSQSLALSPQRPTSVAPPTS